MGTSPHGRVLPVLVRVVFEKNDSECEQKHLQYANTDLYIFYCLVCLLLVCGYLGLLPYRSQVWGLDRLVSGISLASSFSDQDAPQYCRAGGPCSSRRLLKESH